MSERQDIVSLQIEDFPLPLKRKLIARADKSHTNMNDVAVTVLARKFGVEFSPSERTPPVAAGDGTAVAFKMPRDLRRRIKNAAVNSDVAARDVVIGVLTQAIK